MLWNLFLLFSLAAADGQLSKAIFFDDPAQVTALVRANPALLQMAKGDAISQDWLSRAIITQSPRALQALIELGANVNQTNEVRVTALHLAAYHDDETACRLLRNAGASLTVQNLVGQTALEVAKLRQSKKCLSVFAN